MELVILKGKEVSQKIKKEIRDKISELDPKPGLAVVEVGKDPASNLYIKNKEEACREVGIYWEKISLPEDISPDILFREIDRLNKDPKIHGLLVQFPLPVALKSFEEKVIYAINPQKDVDGFHPYNIGQLVSCKGEACKKLLLPSTPYGIIRLLDEYQIPVAGKHAVIIGRSNLTGKPISLLLLAMDATVTICHSQTRDLKSYTKDADILVAAVGKPKFINANYLKKGAVVIDVGINWMDKGIVGDVDFDSVSKTVSAITPVPGGVGPMTVAALLENVLKAYHLQVSR
jgi:methylenetetrahydrofolate dehydrogenase (NADP+) / methenyltetrahydrofolate cyclohydrolase